MAPELRLLKGDQDEAPPLLASFTHDARLPTRAAQILLALATGGALCALLGTAMEPSLRLALGVAAALCAGAGLWQAGAALARKGARYALSARRLDLTRGLFARRQESVELWRVRDVVLDQSVVDRVRGTGTVTLFSTDQVEPTLVIGPIASARQIYEAIRDAAQAARRDARVVTLDRS